MHGFVHNNLQGPHNPEYLDLMTSSFNGLLKYTTCLIIPNIPSRWRSISTTSNLFEDVACMKGYEEVLQKIGYTEKEGTTLSFPEDVHEPDKARLCVLAAELLMAKMEVEEINSEAEENISQQSPSELSSNHIKLANNY